MKKLSLEQMEVVEGGLTWSGATKCALGTVGSGLLGFITGKSLNPQTWSLPIPPGPLGAIGGAMVGAATFCW